MHQPLPPRRRSQVA